MMSTSSSELSLGFSERTPSSKERASLFREIIRARNEIRLFNLALDESVGANVYAKLNEFSDHELKGDTEDQHAKLIEIAIEVGDDVHIIEEKSTQDVVSDMPLMDNQTVHAPKLTLHLEPNYSEDGRPLVIAAADLLITAGRDCDTLLHLVAFHGNTMALDKFLCVFFNPAPTPPLSNVDLRNVEGRTPLHYASGKGHVDVARMLLSQGANKRARDAYGVMPFHFAARGGNTTLLEMLQVEEVDEMASRTGMTALHYAAWNGHGEAVEWLLSHGASVDITDAVEGNTPLHWAASRKKSFRVVDSLIIGGGADAQKENKKGDWPIGLADKGGHHELAKAIVRAIRKSATIRMGVHKSIKAALLLKQQSSNGATLYHFFAAYGTQEDLEWILALQHQRLQDGMASAWQDKATLNLRDKDDRTVVHWAARLANKGALRVLAENKVDLHAGLAPWEPHKTPLSVAVLKGDMEFADELLKWKPPTEDWLRDTKRWLEEYYSDKRKVDAKFQRKFETLQNGFRRHIRQMKILSKKDLFLDMPPIYLALHADREDVAIFIQRYSIGVEDAVNVRGGSMGWTALHWATFLEQRKIVSTLCRSKDFAPFLAANVEDSLGRTALHYAKHMELGDIENELMQRSDVKAYVDGLYKDRQLYVDAANAILVGAALIASVTFAGWLQPPLNYTPYYNLPQLPPPSPPNIYQSYAAIQQNAGVRCFWIFNSLSFTMAISTMLAGLVGVAPIPGIFIAVSVKHLRRCLVIASAFLGISIMFVLAAFAAAGFAVLPPLFEYQANMMATIIVGGVPCLILLVWFAGRLWSFRSRWLRNLEAAVVANLWRVRPASVPDEEIEVSAEAMVLHLCPASVPDEEYRVGRRYSNRPWDDGLDPPASEMP